MNRRITRLTNVTGNTDPTGIVVLLDLLTRQFWSAAEGNQSCGIAVALPFFGVRRPLSIDIVNALDSARDLLLGVGWAETDVGSLSTKKIYGGAALLLTMPFCHPYENNCLFPHATIAEMSNNSLIESRQRMFPLGWLTSTLVVDIESLRWKPRQPILQFLFC